MLLYFIAVSVAFHRLWKSCDLKFNVDERISASVCILYTCVVFASYPGSPFLSPGTLYMCVICSTSEWGSSRSTGRTLHGQSEYFCEQQYLYISPAYTITCIIIRKMSYVLWVSERVGLQYTLELHRQCAMGCKDTSGCIMNTLVNHTRRAYSQ